MQKQISQIVNARYYITKKNFKDTLKKSHAYLGLVVLLHMKVKSQCNKFYDKANSKR